MHWWILLQTALAHPRVAPDHVLIKASETLQPGDTVSGQGVVERAHRVPGWYTLAVPGRPADRLAALRTEPRILQVELDPLLVWDAPSDEPSYGDQWALESGPSYSGSFDADLDAEDAWAQGAFGQGIIVAVIDSGVDLQHGDLRDALWVNPGEIAGNGVDDDVNGFVDDVHGADVASGTGNPDDSDGHGTSCAGIIAAQEDGRSTVGLAPAARIMAVRVVFGSGDAAFAAMAADGIVYAADMGADIISASWHYGGSENAMVTDAIDYAAQRGVLVFAAAGNVALDADGPGNYPARTDHDAIISVAASTRHDEPVDFAGVWGSAWGLDSVDLHGPGEGVLTTDAGGGYTAFSGTSSATPFAAATAALVWSVAPELSAPAVKGTVLAGVDPIGARTVTGGRVNAGAAVRVALGGRAPLQLTIDGPEQPERSELVTLRVCCGEADYRWYFPDTRSFESGSEVQHAFDQPGTWRVAVEGVAAEGTRGRGVLPVSVAIPWHPAALNASSPHDGAPLIGLALLDAGPATWTRYHFSRIDTLTDPPGGEDDYLLIPGPDDQTLWSISGSHDDLWTPALPGQSHLLTWVWRERPGPLRSWGFELDGAEVWSPELDPEPGDTADTATADHRRACGCASGSVPPSGALWLGLVAVGLRRYCAAPSAVASARRRSW